MGPVRELFASARYPRLLSPPYSSGSCPVRLLLVIDRTCSKLHCASRGLSGLESALLSSHLQGGIAKLLRARSVLLSSLRRDHQMMEVSKIQLPVEETTKGTTLYAAAMKN